MDRFADAAARLAGLSAHMLGWSPASFWNATPADLALSLGADEHAPPQPPSRAEIAAMIERDADGR